jgi:WD40 repeat protein
MRRLFLLFTLCLALLVAPVTAQEPSSFAYLDFWNVEPVARIGWGTPYAAAYMPDGQSIVVATAAGVSVYSPQLSELLHIPTWDHAPRELAVSPDGRLIATGGDDVRLWDAETGALIDVMETKPGVAGLAFSADGTRLAATKGWEAVGSYGIFVFDVASGRQLAHLANNAIFAEIAFHPDGQRLIAQRVYDCCGSIAVIDIEGGTNAPGFNPEAHGFTVMPDGEQVLSFMQGIGWVRQDIDEMDAFPVERNPTSAYVAAASPVTADGTFGALTEDGEFALWDADTLSQRETLSLGFKIRVAAISPDGRRIFAVDPADSRVVLASIEDGITDEQSYPSAPQAPMVFQGEVLFYTTADHRIEWLNAGTLWNPIRAAAHTAHTARINALVTSDKFGWLYSASDDGTIQRWHPFHRDSEPEILFKQDDAQIKSLYYSTAHELYAVVCDNNKSGHLLRLNADTGEPIGFFTGGQNSTPIPSIDVACWTTFGTVNGDRISYADHAYFYRLNINSVDTVEREPLPVYDPDGLYAGADGEIMLIDGGAAFVWRGNNSLETIASHIHDITALAQLNEMPFYVFAACARYGYEFDGTPYCSGAEMAMTNWQKPIKRIRGHSGPVRQIVVNQAETLFASVSDDGTIIVWGAPLEPKPLQRYGGIHRLG